MQSSLDSSETMPCRTVGKESGLDPTSSSKDDGDGENSSLLMEKRSTSSGSWILKLDSIMMMVYQLNVSITLHIGASSQG